MTTAITEHSAAKIIAKWLVEQAYGTLPTYRLDWPLYTEILPDDSIGPDNAISVLDTDPVMDGRLFSSGETVVHKGVQVLARSGRHNYQAGNTKLLKISKALDDLLRQAVTLDSTTYIVQSCTRRSGPAFIGTSPERSLNYFSLNITATITV